MIQMLIEVAGKCGLNINKGYQIFGCGYGR